MYHMSSRAQYLELGEVILGAGAPRSELVGPAFPFKVGQERPGTLVRLGLG